MINYFSKDIANQSTKLDDLQIALNQTTFHMQQQRNQDVNGLEEKTANYFREMKSDFERIINEIKIEFDTKFNKSCMYKFSLLSSSLKSLFKKIN